MHTILVADDSVTILKAVEIVFDKEPFQVVKAGSGAEAIARARELKPALVLTDHTMGDKSGYEVAEALHADPATSSIPVMILSHTSQPFDEARAKAAGVVGHVPKPFDCQTLLDRVRNVLGVAATAPGTFAGASPSPAQPSAAVAAMPRPPGVPGAAAMPRPPGAAAGFPRPAGTGSGAPAAAPFSAQQASTGAPSSSSIAITPSIGPATPMNRTPTPQPSRTDLDPFGFGASLGNSTSGAGASSSSSPRPVTTPPSPAPQPLTSTPMTSPPSLTAQAPAGQNGSSNGDWKAARGGLDISGDDTLKKPSSPSFVGDTEFLEVADIEVTDIPSSPSLPPVTMPVSQPMQANPAATTQKVPVIGGEDGRSTDKVDVSRLARMDAEAAGRPAVKLELATAADLVAEEAATVIAKTTGGAAPSREALTEEARQIVERVAWEVVPELAEVIIREEIQRLLKSRG